MNGKAYPRWYCLCQRGAGSGTGVQECRERRHNHHGCLYAAHRALSARHPRLVQIQCFRGRQRWGEQQIRVAVFTLRLLLYLAESGGRRQGDRWHQFAADHGQRVVPQRQTTERNQGLCVLSRFVEEREEGSLPLSAVLCHAQAVREYTSAFQASGRR